MDATLDVIERATTAIDYVIPSQVPVPVLISTAAKMLSQAATSPSFPYRINNIELGDVALWQALIVILLQPLLWNFIGRFEHYTRLLSFLFFNKYIGTYVLALWIIVAGFYRNALFVSAMDNQVQLESMGAPEYRIAGFVLGVLGLVLVFSSFYRLGMTATFLGDYFGILLDAKVTGFPFNILSDPMYDGSTLIFLAKAILSKSPAGVLISCWVYMVYRLACLFEGPFTAKIYAARSSEKLKKEN